MESNICLITVIPCLYRWKALGKKYVFYPVELEIFNQKQNCKRASTKYLHLGASELSYQQMFWYEISLWTHIVFKGTLILLYFNCGVAFHSHVEMKVFVLFFLSWKKSHCQNRARSCRGNYPMSYKERRK